MSKQLFYWQRNAKGSSAEVDFLIERKGKIYPIEVKSRVNLEDLKVFI